MGMPTTRRQAAGRIALVVLWALLWFWPNAPARADDPELRAAQQEAEQAWQDLNQWLSGGGAQGRGWRRFLRAREIEDQWGLADRIDAARLRRLQERLSAPEPGLESPKFRRLRAAVDRWAAVVEARRQEAASQRIEQVKSAVKLPTDDEVRAARRELQQAIEHLDNFLALYGENGARWQQFLKHDDLRKQLASPDVEDRQTIVATLNRYTSGEVGLDNPMFVRVRRALERFKPRLYMQQKDDFPKDYERFLGGLATRLDTYDKAETKSDTALREVALTVGWLEEHGQALDLIDWIRRRHSRPNVFVNVSEELAQVLMQRQVDRNTPISDVVLGTSICGVGQLHGRLDLHFVPDARRAVFQTAFSGTIATNTHGVNPPACIDAVGCTQLTAGSRLFLEPSGLTASPTSSHADVNTTITGIGAMKPGIRGRIIRRVARRKAAQSKGEAEAVAAQHAEEKFNKEMDGEAGQQVAKANDTIETKFRAPLERLNLYPRELGFRTTPDELLAVALEAGPNQFGAPTAPPALEQDSSLALRVHRSSIINMVLTLLRDRYLDEPTMQALARKTIGRVPEELKNEEGQGEWRINFDPVEPVAVDFVDGELKITVRGKTFVSDGEPRREPMNITARYRFESSAKGGLKLARQGVVEALPPRFEQSERKRRESQEKPEGAEPAKQEKMTPYEATFSSLLERRFKRLLQEEFEIDGFGLPGEGAKAGSFWLVEHRIEDGWLTLAWKRDPNRAPKFIISREAQAWLTPQIASPPQFVSLERP